MFIFYFCLVLIFVFAEHTHHLLLIKKNHLLNFPNKRHLNAS